jgi:hypothetical protein
MRDGLAAQHEPGYRFAHPGYQLNYDHFHDGGDRS